MEGKRIILSIIFAIAVLSLSGMAGASSAPLELATMPQKVYLEEVDGRVNYAFHILFRNISSRQVRLGKARFAYHLHGESMPRLLHWQNRDLRQKSASGNTVIAPGGGTLLLRGIGEEFVVAPDGFTIDVVFTYALEDGNPGECRIRVPVQPYRQKTVFTLPFDKPWYVINGHGIHESHRLAALGQSFAWDFTFRPTGRDCRLEALLPETRVTSKDFYGFAEHVLAPADGTVVQIKKQEEDGSPTVIHSPYLGETPDAPEDMLGNYVVIEHDANEFSLLAHLKKDSVIVKPQQVVQRGQFIGQCGNSGDSTYPHIHFQVMDGPDHFSSLGLPVKLSSFRQERKGLTKIVSLGSPIRGDMVGSLIFSEKSEAMGER